VTPKQAAAQAAAGLVRDGMTVGLGSGSTAALVLEFLAARVRAGLRITGIPTSDATAHHARDLGIPLGTLDEHPQPDLTIDGADEVETGTLHLIKGRGGALLREKIVAQASTRLIVVVDESKLVRRLGERTPVPVEVIPFGWRATAQRLRLLGAEPVLRPGPFLTDSGNYILDCGFGSIAAPEELGRALDSIAGVAEHGLFLAMTDLAIVGGEDGVRELNPRRSG
jgi:ribose 5-phosphate isomerase A